MVPSFSHASDFEIYWIIKLKPVIEQLAMFLPSKCQILKLQFEG